MTGITPQLGHLLSDIIEQYIEFHRDIGISDEILIQIL